MYRMSNSTWHAIWRNESPEWNIPLTGKFDLLLADTATGQYPSAMRCQWFSGYKNAFRGQATESNPTAFTYSHSLTSVSTLLEYIFKGPSMEPLSYQSLGTVRIRSMVLTQPGTPVSFRGMFIHSLFDFQKLRIFWCFPFLENSGTPTFLISRNSRLWCFLRFLYYVITLISCLHLSLVTLSAVVSTSLSLDPQFPFALPYCLAYITQFPLLCTWYNSSHSLVISTCIL